MGKRQESAARTRASIIASAHELIQEKSLDEICVEDITLGAGVSKGSFYTYFDSKEDVVSAVAYKEFDEFLTGTDDKTTEERLTAFLMGSIRYIADSGLRLCQTWISCAVSKQCSNGREKMGYDLSALTGIIGDRGKAEAVLQEYYGIVLLWAISDGALDPVERMSEFCEGPMLSIIGG